MKGVVLTALCFLFACRPEAPRPTNTTVAGDVYLIAPIANAKVQVSLLRGGAAEVVGSGQTDENGHFDIELFAAEGTLLIEVTGEQGGTTKEPVSGKLLQLSLSDRFSNLMASVKLGERYEGIVISPWSTLVSQRALWDVETNHVAIEEALVASAQLFVSHFGGIAFFSSAPLDPAAAPTNGLSTGAVHGFATAALAVMGADLSRRLRLSEGNLINTVSLTQWLANDLRADGRFDGRGKAGMMNVIDDQNVDIEFTRSFLGAALGTFVTSEKNLSGVGLADLRGVINAITLDTSVLYGSSSSIAVSQGAGPTITISSPVGGSTLRDQAFIFGKAESASGVAGVEISLDGSKLGGGEREAVNRIAWAQEVPLIDGFHVLKVTARDSSGVASDLTVTFQSDATPPTVKLAFCKAFDDMKRAFPPRVNGDGSIAWNSPASPDPACGLERLQPKTNPSIYTFRTYAELAKRAATSSFVAVVPEDNGQVFTEQSKLIVEAGIYRDNVQVGITTKFSAASLGESTRQIPISAEAFGAELLDVSAEDTLELRIVVVDGQANESALSIFFHLDLLSSPLMVIDATPPTSSGERIEHYAFDAGNAQQAFDPSLYLPAHVFAVRRFRVKNVSDRDTALKLTTNPGGTLAASVTQWRGLYAAMRVRADFDYGSDTKQLQSQLVTPTFGPHWGDCYNEIASTQLTDSTMPSNPYVVAVSNGSASCIRAEDVLAGGVTQTAAGTWGFAVQKENGDAVFPAGGEYVLPAGATYFVTLGFTQPNFPSTTVNACTPTYEKGWIEYDYYDRADTFSRNQLALLPGGFLAQPRVVYQSGGHSNTGASYSERGYMDCRGFNCDGVDCRRDSDQYIIRIEGQPTVRDSFLYSGEWWRQANRPWAEFSLSRVYFVSSFSVTGSAQFGTAARLTTNSARHDELFDLTPESVSVNYTARSNINPPNHGVRYTKGILP